MSKGCAATAPRTRAAECRVPTHSGVGSGSARMWDSLRSTRDAVNPARTVVWCKVEVVHPRSKEIRLPSPRVPAPDVVRREDPREGKIILPVPLLYDMSYVKHGGGRESGRVIE